MPCHAMPCCRSCTTTRIRLLFSSVRMAYRTVSLICRSRDLKEARLYDAASYHIDAIQAPRGSWLTIHGQQISQARLDDTVVWNQSPFTGQYSGVYTATLATRNSSCPVQALAISGTVLISAASRSSNRSNGLLITSSILLFIVVTMQSLRSRWSSARLSLDRCRTGSRPTTLCSIRTARRSP